jgi:hypothetical protein
MALTHQSTESHASKPEFRRATAEREAAAMAEEKIHLDWARMVQAEAQGQAEIAHLAHQHQEEGVCRSHCNANDPYLSIQANPASLYGSRENCRQGL